MVILIFSSFHKQLAEPFFLNHLFLEKYMVYNYPTLLKFRHRYIKIPICFSNNLAPEIFQLSYDAIVVNSKEPIKNNNTLLILDKFFAYFSLILTQKVETNSHFFETVFKISESSFFVKQDAMYHTSRAISFSASRKNKTAILKYMMVQFTKSAMHKVYGFESSHFFKLMVRFHKRKQAESYRKNKEIYTKFYTQFSNEKTWNRYDLKNNSQFWFISFKRLIKVNLSSDHLAFKFKALTKPSDNAKSINLFTLAKDSNLVLRKNKIFNKGRYSRNRQLYRTGVYWSIWLNILLVFGLYYYFYRFTFNFGYVWLPMGVFIVSIFFSRLVKYRLYNYNNLITELSFLVNLISHLLKVVITETPKILKSWFKQLSSYYVIEINTAMFFIKAKLKFEAKTRRKIKKFFRYPEEDSFLDKVIGFRLKLITYIYMDNFLHRLTYLKKGDDSLSYFWRHTWRIDRTSPDKWTPKEIDQIKAEKMQRKWNKENAEFMRKVNEYADYYINLKVTPKKGE
jgi:hypothetical protein